MWCLVLILVVASGEASVDLEVYDSLEEEPQIVQVESESIVWHSDAFRVTIRNQSLSRLRRDSVRLFEELSIFEIVHSELQDLEPFCFNITADLTLLKISHNSLREIKAKVLIGIRTKELDLSHNLIVSIAPQAFDHQHHLQLVKLSYNALKSVDPLWFSNTPNVHQLDLIYNEITELKDNLFVNLSKHRPIKLRLSANRIASIQPQVFAGLHNIRVVRLNGNKLTRLPGELFLNRTISSLQVNTNDLSCFPPEMYTSKLLKLAFSENPHFTCDCLKQVRRFVDAQHISVLYPAIICEDRQRDVNVVFNNNKTYEIPIVST